VDSHTKLFLGGAGALLLVLVALPSKGSRPAVPAVAPAALPTVPVGPANAQPRVGTPDELLRQAEHTAALGWGRDPFARPAAPEPVVEPEPLPIAPEPAPPEPEPDSQPPLPHVTGIGLGANGTYAILDRRVVQVGDRLSDGFEVLRIERGVVTVGYGGAEVPLILGD
jgi:hypothetical protein